MLEILDLIYKFFLSLRYLHGIERISHADIKPDNLMVTKNMDIIKIIDFGISDQIGVSDAVGSPYYNSPTKILKLDRYDERHDVYASVKTIADALQIKQSHEGLLFFCSKFFKVRWTNRTTY